jgi:hypothetical protein
MSLDRKIEPVTNYPLEQAKLRDRYVPRGPRGSLQNMFKCVFFFCNEIAFSTRNTDIPPSTRAAYDEAVAGMRTYLGDPTFTPKVDPALFAL